MKTDQANTSREHGRLINERRSGQDRRKVKDRRDEIRFENCRRKNHGRRIEDRDFWKESLELK
ncbi:hypothetical protein [uncultured Amphritea sp.]|uniref:hypothetical protein n=1 Tax=uncultured Amphritea sp. TaxID=981605 RepID=UPI0026107EE8|nr:hypothetical protein [uncultured Amphritea sp.]